MRIGILLCLIVACQASYDITLYTSNKHWAGTDANIWVILRGSKGQSRLQYLKWAKHHNERNSKDTYTVNGDYGYIRSISIGHNKKGHASGWHLSMVKVRDNTRGTVSSGGVGKWISSNTVTVNFKVDGGWSTWINSPCSATCSNGVVKGTRTCTNPTPRNGGKTCSGASKATTSCKVKECPVNGGWSSWTSGSCSAKCGSGLKTLTRKCNRPAPAFGGRNCLGSGSMTRPCKIMECLINGGWGSWGNYSVCSATCGQGVQSRSRVCNTPSPQHGGKTCEGKATEKRNCQIKECPAKCPKNVPKEKRYDGGWHGITKEECLKRGSCYDNTSCKQCNWCYISPEKLTGKECPLVAPPAAKKIDAGKPGMTSAKCVQAGHCWHQGPGPWCYKNPNA